MQPAKETKKPGPKKCYQYVNNQQTTYAMRMKKETPATVCSSPVRIGKTDKYFENLTYSFVQASISDHPSKESIGRFPSSASCERCNPPQYQFRYDRMTGEEESANSCSWLGELMCCSFFSGIFLLFVFKFFIGKQEECTGFFVLLALPLLIFAGRNTPSWISRPHEGNEMSVPLY